MQHTATLRRRQRQAGFTILEIVIVVVIIGILAAIGYPAYQDQAEKTRRAMALMDWPEGARRLSVAGGVAANKTIRAALDAR